MTSTINRKETTTSHCEPECHMIRERDRQTYSTHRERTNMCWYIIITKLVWLSQWTEKKRPPVNLNVKSLVPVLNEQEGFYQLGPPQSCTDQFVLSVTIAYASNLPQVREWDMCLCVCVHVCVCVVNACVCVYVCVCLCEGEEGWWLSFQTMWCQCVSLPTERLFVIYIYIYDICVYIEVFFLMQSMCMYWSSLCL